MRKYFHLQASYVVLSIFMQQKYLFASNLNSSGGSHVGLSLPMKSRKKVAHDVIIILLGLALHRLAWFMMPQSQTDRHFLVHLAIRVLLPENSGRLNCVRLQQPQEQRYPFLSVRAVFSCVQTKVWLPVLGIFDVRTDVNIYDWTSGL